MISTNNPLSFIEDMIRSGNAGYHSEVQRRLETTQNNMLSEGVHNGVHGIVIPADTVDERASAYAERCRNEITVIIEQNLARLAVDEKAAKHDCDHAEAVLDAVNHSLFYQRLVAQTARQSQGRLSITAYSLIGALLILADIALAYQLVYTCFGLEDPLPLLQLFSRQFFAVLFHNGPGVLVTLGIATFTVTLKLAFDRFIGSPYGDEQVKRLQFTMWFTKKNPGNNPEEQVTGSSQPGKEELLKDMQRQLQQHEKIKRYTLLALVLLTVGFLFALAQLRSQAEDLKQKIAVFNHAGVNEEEEITPDALKHRIDIAAQEKTDAEQNIRAWRTCVFFGITLLFPAVCALCFSVAGMALENKRRIRTFSKDADEAATKLKLRQKEHATAKGNLESWVTDKGLAATADWINTFTTRLKGLYNYGYTIGNVRPDLFHKIPDLYSTIDRYRRKENLFFANQKLNNTNN